MFHNHFAGEKALKAQYCCDVSVTLTAIVCYNVNISEIERVVDLIFLKWGKHDHCFRGACLTWPDLFKLPAKDKNIF